MIKYVKEMVEAFPNQEEIKKKATTPAAPHLFQVREVKKRDKDKAKIFHHIVVKGLFLCTRSRADIQPTIAFLTTRVKRLDKDDWKKLIRMLRYLNGTTELKTTLSANFETNKGLVFKWYIDAAFAVNADFNSHTGGALTMGKGSINNILTKQN